MKSIVVGENDGGQRLDKFLIKTYPSLPLSLMNKAIRKKDVKINGNRSKNFDIISKGDIISLYIHYKFLKTEKVNMDFLDASDDLNIAYEDENLLILDKPEGLLVHPDGKEFTNTLITQTFKYLYGKGEYSPETEHQFSPALANRIDRNTCGLVMAAKNAAFLRFLNEQISKRTVRRFYICLVSGILEEKQGVLRGYIKKDHDLNKVTLCSENSDRLKESETKYKVLKENEKRKISLLEIELISGRTHQIRIHLASKKHPILGDNKYGNLIANQSFNVFGQALCAYKLVFDFEKSPRYEEYNYLSAKEVYSNTPWFLKDKYESFF